MPGPDGGDEALPTVTVVGLGPAGPEYLTAAASTALTSGSRCYVRTSRHPAAVPLVEAGAIPLDDHYDAAESFSAAYGAIVETLVDAATRHGRIVYAVPGSPAVLEHTVALLRTDPRVHCELVAGLSFLDLAWQRLGVDPVTAHVRLVDAETFAVDAAGDPGPLLVCQTWSRAVLSQVKIAVETPPSTPVVLLHHLGLADERVEIVDWSDLDRTLEADHLTCLYVPDLEAPVLSAMARTLEIVRELRERCPWDAEQTHRSLVRHLIEESYEAVEAIEELGDDPDAARLDHLIEELGDVLCQVLFHSVIAEQAGMFNLADVAQMLGDKLVRRHPHVYGDAQRADAATVLAGWETMKQQEKGRESLLDGIPAALPALLLADKLERRSATVGLGLEAGEALRGDLLAKLDAVIAGRVADAGGLLFTLARLVAHLGGDPEEAVRAEAGAYREQFAARERGRVGTEDRGHLGPLAP